MADPAAVHLDSFLNPESLQDLRHLDLRHLPAQRYAELQASLTRRWRDFVGLQGSLSVEYDAPVTPGTATLTAINTLTAASRHERLRVWMPRNVRNAVVHCAEAVDLILFEGDTLHFFECKLAEDRTGTGIFDSLTDRQKDDYRALCSADTDPRADFDRVFFSAILAHPDDDPNHGTDRPGEEPWTDAKNSRRCDLIDKEIEGNLTQAERAELDDLQQQAIAYRDRVAPLPIEGARKLHRQLLERKQQLEGQD